MSFDVKLLRSHVPLFPDRCIQCGSEPLGETLRDKAESSGHWYWLTAFFRRKFAVDVPVCANCQTQVHRDHRNRQVVLFVLLAAGLAAAFVLLQYYRGPFKKLIMMGIVGLAILPYAIWIVACPPPLNMVAHSNAVDYEFKNEEYAGEFSRLNGDALTR